MGHEAFPGGEARMSGSAPKTNPVAGSNGGSRQPKRSAGRPATAIRTGMVHAVRTAGRKPCGVPGQTRLVEARETSGKNQSRRAFGPHSSRGLLEFRQIRPFESHFPQPILMTGCWPGRPGSYGSGRWSSGSVCTAVATAGRRLAGSEHRLPPHKATGIRCSRDRKLVPGGRSETAIPGTS